MTNTQAALRKVNVTR